MNTETCDTCSGPFETAFFGQCDCLPCTRANDLAVDGTAMLQELALDSTSSLETCRDLAEDIIALLSVERLSTKKRAAALVLANRLRVCATDATPDADEYFLE